MSKARTALVNEFNTLFPELAGKVKYENKEFSPPVGTSLWASLAYVDADQRPITMGTGGEDEIRGFLQIDFNVPYGKGEGDLLAAINKATRHFRAGLAPAFEDEAAEVYRSATSLGRQVDTWWRKTVTVFFYSRVFRDQ